MQSNKFSVHRGALFLSGVAAVALCFYGYSYFSARSQAQSGAKLHRSNATHGRRRRRLQSATHSNHANRDPLARALEHLAQAEESGRGFGVFNDRDYINTDLMERHGDSFALLPSRLDYIREMIIGELSLSQEEGEQLRSDISTMFMDNFIRAAFPQGYYVAGDAAALQHALTPQIDPTFFQEYMESHYPLDGGFVGGLPHSPSNLDLPLSSAANMAQALSGGEEARSTRPVEQWGQTEEQREDHQVLDLLYRIGEEQAKRNGYQHRGVQCNGCSMQPIMGIRYHCANCWDYDLCEMCEAQQIHYKTHVFYKIRIPAPTRGQIKLVQPKWYPGEPNACPESVPPDLREQLLAITDLKRQELEAFYDQFKCVAGKSYEEDPSGVCMAIDRPGFDKYFTSTTADRAPTPNLIYDRIFSFYDADGDGLISFAEFAKGMAELAYNTSREARIQRLFKAFDIDGDGYVDRRDFLYLLRAHYSLSKELAHEMIYAREDALLTDEEIQEVIHGNNPISAAFGGSSFAGHQSRHGLGKHVDAHGDLVFDDDVSEVLRADSPMLGNRTHAIARQASDRASFMERTSRDDPLMGYYILRNTSAHQYLLSTENQQSELQEGQEDVDRLGHVPNDRWLEHQPQQQDVLTALGTDVPLEDVMDPIDRRRVLQAQRERILAEMEANNLEIERTAVEERWQRRQFYLDEEQGFQPMAAYHESDSSDDEQEVETNGEVKQPTTGPSARRPSLRSRSSSKVRFEDSTMQSEVETRSDISSRNTPLNERWGGFEFSQPDRDVGIEVIYEAVQEAFNDILNHFFKEQEDKCMAAKGSRAQRLRYKADLDAYEKSLVRATERQEQALLDADMELTNDLLEMLTGRTTEAAADQKNGTQDQIESLDEQHPSQASTTEMNSPPTSEGDLKVFHSEAPTNETKEDDVSHPKSSKPLQSDATSPSQTDLRKWHEHNLVDAEANIRRGYGRLNLQEFKRKLRDEITDDIDVGAEGKDDEYFWEAKADLGKFSFLSTWIEMASF